MRIFSNVKLALRAVELKIKLSLHLTASRHEGVCNSGGKIPRILSLWTRMTMWPMKSPATVILGKETLILFGLKAKWAPQPFWML